MHSRVYVVQFLGGYASEGIFRTLGLLVCVCACICAFIISSPSALNLFFITVSEIFPSP